MTIINVGMVQCLWQMVIINIRLQCNMCIGKLRIAFQAIAFIPDIWRFEVATRLLCVGLGWRSPAPSDFPGIGHHYGPNCKRLHMRPMGSSPLCSELLLSHASWFCWWVRTMLKMLATHTGTDPNLRGSSAHGFVYGRVMSRKKMCPSRTGSKIHILLFTSFI